MPLSTFYINSSLDFLVSFGSFYVITFSFPSAEYKTRSCIPKLVTDYMQRKFNTDSLITHQFPFEKINKAFELFRSEHW